MSGAPSIAERVRDIKAAVAIAAIAAGRAPGDITIVAASKAQPVSALREAWAAGVRHFGENYAAEMATKMDGLDDLPGITWHFIGRVQRGNARTIVRADVVHGVGSRGQAEALAKARRATGAPPLPILLQVNVADEDTKNGFATDDVAAAATDIAALDGVTICGLMAMPDVDDAQLPAAFDRVRQLRDDVGPAWPVLSMGMSGDFEAAIAAGATHVRIGTRLFGPRPTTATAAEAS